MMLLGVAWLVTLAPGLWQGMSVGMRLLVLVLGAIDFGCGALLHFIVQHDVAARFDQLSICTRINFAGKLRLGQPFLADALATPVWLVGSILVSLFGLACWQVVKSKRSANRLQPALPAMAN